MDSLRTVGALSLLLWVSSGACVTVPRPVHEPKSEPVASSEEMEPEPEQPEASAEWLFVTSQGPLARGKKAECTKVQSWVLGEAKCAGQMCRPGRDLAKEWVEGCSKVMPEQADKIRELADMLDERVKAGANQCSRQGESLLRADECGTPEQCERATQTWITRCGPRYATPLVTLMLTKTLQRRFPDDPNKPRHVVRFDKRSCQQLEQQIASAVGCDGPEACKQAVDARSAWMDRCYDPKIKLPVKLAFQMADILVGAGQGVDPMDVSPIERKLPPGVLPVSLPDDKGGASWICGVRPKNLAEYLDTRKTCRKGEVIFLHLNHENQLRAISVPHPNNREFSRLFPFLRVKGEHASYVQSRVEPFRSSMAEVVELASGSHPERAIAPFTRAVMSNLWLIAKSQKMQQILRDSDLALVKMFQAWGKKKVKKVYRIRSKTEQVMFVGRARHSPLDDMTPDGTIRPGSFATPWALDLRSLMPSSFAAYEEPIEKLRMFTRLHHLKDSQVDHLRQVVASQIRQCSSHEKRIEQALEKAEHCVWEDPSCTQDKMRALSASVDPDRHAAQAERMAIQLILASGVFSRDEVQRLESERLASGCLDP